MQVLELIGGKPSLKKILDRELETRVTLWLNSIEAVETVFAWPHEHDNDSRESVRDPSGIENDALDW